MDLLKLKKIINSHPTSVICSIIIDYDNATTHNLIIKILKANLC